MENLNRPITSKEIETVIKNFPTKNVFYHNFLNNHQNLPTKKRRGLDNFTGRILPDI